jgi:hypothetical protein
MQLSARRCVICWFVQQHHGGYRFPWFLVGDQPNFHDFHHEKFTGGVRTWELAILGLF